MSKIIGNYTQTTVTTPSAPSTTSKFDLEVQAPFIREIVAEGIVEEPKLQQELDSARSFFTGDTVFKSDTLLNNLKFGQEVRVNIEKDQNPLGLFKKDTIGYTTVDSCHDRINLDCAVPCINTLPTFQYIKFRFDTEYAYGVRACDKNTDFWDLNFFTKQYALSKRACDFGKELDLWNTTIRGLIAAPATTVDAKLAAKHPTHYWSNQGDVATNAKALITEAHWYMVTNFADIDPYTFMPVEMAKAIVDSVQNPYNLNRSQVLVNTFQDWEVPGFMIATAVEEVLGTVKNVRVMKRSPWLTTATATAYGSTYASNFPLWSQDTTKQYCAILDPRVSGMFEKPGYHLNILPYDCDKLVRGMIDTVYTGSFITFPIYGLVIEFNGYTHA